MSLGRRISMNTSLKDARIFDDELDLNPSTKSRRNSFTCYNDNAQFPSISETNKFRETIDNDMETKVVCKLEPLDPDEINFNISQEQFENITIKHEFDDSNSNSNSCSGKFGKSEKITVFKREMPYVKPEPDDDSPTKSIQKEKKKYESNPAILSRRQKQIDYGKNTIGYDNYVKTIPRNQRQSGDPMTPNKYIQYSRRAWDGLIKQWRLRLHKFDP